LLHLIFIFIIKKFKYYQVFLIYKIFLSLNIYKNFFLYNYFQLKIIMLNTSFQKVFIIHLINLFYYYLKLKFEEILIFIILIMILLNYLTNLIKQVVSFN